MSQREKIDEHRPSLAHSGKIKRCFKRSLQFLVLFFLVVIAVVIKLALSSEPVTFDEDLASGIRCEEWTQLIPGPSVPTSFEAMDSNNNLDVVAFEGQTFVAYRSAPTHFASTETRLNIMRSNDRKTWRAAASFQFQCDLREPRFMVHKGKLFFYFFQGGSKILEFAPKHLMACEWREEEETFSEPRTIFEPGYVVWRARSYKGVAYMSVYYGAGLYTTADRPGEIRLLVSQDGYSWEPISKDPQVTDVGAEEGEFAFAENGDLVATVRLETGGSLICVAKEGRLDQWEKHFIPDKIDSGFLFRRGENFYLIARRNVAGAKFLRGPEFLPMELRRGWSLARYSLTRKRTSLYKLDLKNYKLQPLVDFPSKGDTAFAGLMALDDQRYYLLNYSCPLDGTDWPWLAGQFLTTRIYQTELSFPEDK